MTTSTLTPRNLTLEHSRAALRQYDKVDKPALKAVWEEIVKCESTKKRERIIMKWSTASDEAVERVQNAFWMDTQDRNSRDRCVGVVSISYIREMVGKHGV